MIAFYKGWVNGQSFYIYRAILSDDETKITAGYSERLYYEEDTGETKYIDMERDETPVDWQGYIHVPIGETGSTHYCF